MEADAPRKRFDAAALDEKREALRRDRHALEAAGQLRTDHNASRVRDAAAEASASSTASEAAIGGCFVSRPSASAGANEHVLRRVFLDEERLARKTGRAGVGSRELRAVLETCTGCVPTAAECRAMLGGARTVDVDAFLAIYRAVQSGGLEFAALSQTMDAFDSLCHAMSDAA